MATLREHVSKAGETTYAVLFRAHGRQTSRTFAAAPKPHDPAKYALDFKALVDLLGGERALATLGVTESKPRLTVDQLADRFLEWKGRPSSGVTSRTVDDYRATYVKWIRPTFGARPAEDVDEVEVQSWVDKLELDLAPKTVAGHHMILNSMYDFGRAKTRRLVTHNPCLETQLPKKRKRRAKGTTVPEYQAIRAAALPDAADLIEFIGETGWRWSEAAALPARVVELDGPDVWVTVDQVFRIVDGRQVLVPDEAKSWAAFRRIRLFPDSAATVRRRLAGLGPDDLVFTNSRGTRWNQNTFLRETWPNALRRAGLWQGARRSPTPKWLRNMHVAVLISAGASLPEIQRRIGHESIQTTIDVYGGMIGDIGDASLTQASAIMTGRAPSELLERVEAEVVRGELVDLELDPD